MTEKKDKVVSSIKEAKESGFKAMLKAFKRPSRIIVILIAVSCFLLAAFSQFLLNGIGIYNPKLLFLTKAFFEILGWVLAIFCTRELSWQIDPVDYRKFIPLATMLFFMVFIYTSGRIIKDFLANLNLDNENTVIAKMFVLFFTVAYQAIYIKLSERLKHSTLLHISVVPIVLYLVIFALFLHNNKAILPSPAFIQSVMTAKMTSFSGFFKVLIRPISALIAHWPISLYYIFAEMFAVLGLTTFIWQVIHSQFDKDKMKKLIPVFLLVAQIATLLSGYLCDGGYGASEVSVIMTNTAIMVLATISCIVINTVFFFVPFKGETIGQDRFIKSKAEVEVKPSVEGDVKIGSEGVSVKSTMKTKITWSQALKKNYAFILIAFLSVFYGVATLFLEQFWKKSITQVSRAKGLELMNKMRAIIDSGDEEKAKILLSKLNVSASSYNKKTAIEYLSKITEYGFFNKVKSVVGNLLGTPEYINMQTKIADAQKTMSTLKYAQFYSNCIRNQARLSIMFVGVITNLLVAYTSWIFTSLLTPVFAIASAFAIIGFAILNRMFHFIDNINVLHYVITIIGTYFICTFKTLKYAAFDTAKEAFISNQSDKDKADIKGLEGLFGRVGKTLGGVLLTALLWIISRIIRRPATIDHIVVASVLFILTIVTSIVWVIAVVTINKSDKMPHHKKDDHVVVTSQQNNHDNHESKDSKTKSK